MSLLHEGATAVGADRGPEADEKERGGLVWPLATCALVALLALVPLINNRIFYYWDDSAAQFLPTWHHLGTLIRDGQWPPLLDVDAWMGGNYAAEALFGIYNPLYVANYVLVSLLPDLAVSALLVKAQFMVLLALGTYLVARDYGAARWASSAVAVALPFSGFTLYFDTAGWASGLMSFSMVPLLWWAARRMADGRMNPFWVFLIGALIVTGGNPYGVLGICIVLLGLIVENLVRGRRAVLVRLVLVGLCIGLVVPLVFLALLGSSSVTWRSGQGIWNDGMLVPGLGDLLNLSAPTYLPQISNWQATMHSPVAYFAWFVVPLVPWLRWGVLRDRWKQLTSVGVIVVAYLLLTLSPSQLWMFRWPLRLIESVYLGLAVLVAVVLSEGLRTDKARARAAASGALILFATYLSWAGTPQHRRWHVLALVVVAGLTALAVWAARRGTGRLAIGLHAGTAAVLLLQTSAFVGNFNVNPYYYPHSVQELRASFASYQGATMQFADRRAVDRLGRGPDGAWDHILFGTAYRAAGVNAVNTYTGMGFKDFSDTFCMSFIGESCEAGYRNLWAPRDDRGTTLAEMMRLDTVVVERGLLDRVEAPDGWRVQERDDAVTVLAREAPHAWPDGRLGSASEGVEVLSDTSPEETAEAVRFRVADDAEPAVLTFARLNWPGYTAQVDGREVPVTTGPAGLLQVELPEGVDEGELTLEWTPPGFTAGLALGAAGLVGALVLALFGRRWKRQGGR